MPPRLRVSRDAPLIRRENHRETRAKNGAVTSEISASFQLMTNSSTP